MADAPTIHEALSAVMGDVQAVGKGQRVTSGPAQYAFRVALLQALCIPTDEPDPDASSHERATGPTVISAEEAARIRDLIDGSDDPAANRKAFRTRFNHGAADLPAALLDEANDWLRDLEPVPPVAP